MLANPQPLRSVTAEEIEQFDRDGVVCLRAILPTEWIKSMEGPVADVLDSEETANMTAMAESMAASDSHIAIDTRADGTGRFISGVDHYLNRSVFAEFAIGSAVAQVVSELLGGITIRLYEDSVLEK